MRRPLRPTITSPITRRPKPSRTMPWGAGGVGEHDWARRLPRAAQAAKATDAASPCSATHLQASLVRRRAGRHIQHQHALEPHLPQRLHAHTTRGGPMLNAGQAPQHRAASRALRHDQWGAASGACAPRSRPLPAACLWRRDSDAQHRADDAAVLEDLNLPGPALHGRWREGGRRSEAGRWEGHCHTPLHSNCAACPRPPTWPPHPPTCVNGDGKPDARAGALARGVCDRGVDADQAAARVQQRAARVARLMAASHWMTLRRLLPP